MTLGLCGGPHQRNNTESLESNSSRLSRQATLQFRPLQRWGTGLLVYDSIRDFPTEAKMHWGIRVGPFLHELHTDEGKNGYPTRNNLYGAECWLPEGAITLGRVKHTDVEIDGHAEETRKFMEENEYTGGRYHIYLNNCQVFCQILAHKLGVPFSKLTNIPWSNAEWLIWREKRLDIRGLHVKRPEDLRGKGRSSTSEQQPLIREVFFGKNPGKEILKATSDEDLEGRDDLSEKEINATIAKVIPQTTPKANLSRQTSISRPSLSAELLARSPVSRRNSGLSPSNESRASITSTRSPSSRSIDIGDFSQLVQESTGSTRKRNRDRAMRIGGGAAGLGLIGVFAAMLLSELEEDDPSTEPASMTGNEE